MAAALRTTWPQVLAWRMRRHLLDPVQQVEATDIVRRLCGVQAQVLAAAALAIGVRQSDPVPDAMEQALRDGRLMRTWAMRGTLHLMTPDQAGAYLALMSAGRSWERGSWVRAFGVTPDDMVTLTETIAEVLDDKVLTRAQLVAEVANRLGRPDLEAQLRSGWGAVLKPIAWQGVLCHGPADGSRVTFGRPDRLVAAWKGLPAPEEAALVAVAAYLRAHGPAAIERFDAWLTRGTSSKATRRGWLAALEDRMVAVDVEGTVTYLLAEDLDDLAGTAPTTAVRLLGGFDQYVLGPGTAATEILAPGRRGEVSRTAGWIAPVVIDAGRVAGVWDLDKGVIDIRLFDEGEPIAPAILDAAVERTRSVLGVLRPG